MPFFSLHRLGFGLGGFFYIKSEIIYSICTIAFKHVGTNVSLQKMKKGKLWQILID
jgi:hypothetical protein